MHSPKSSESTERPLVRHIATTGGELYALLGTIVRIKVGSLETLGTFCVCEARVPPNAFVPLHYHRDVEVFFVLKGTLEVMRGVDGEVESLPVNSCEMALIPSNAVHGFRNTSGRHVNLLVIGGPGIESFLVEAGRPRYEVAPREKGLSGSDDFQGMLEIAKRHGQVFIGDH
jgi:mannose-6-phosphate isomerase-like protein (cupin superfamily)